MKKLILLLSVIGMCSTCAFADEWVVPLKVTKRPNNHPTKNPFVKVNPKLDALGFRMMLDGQMQVGIRVRNGKHKIGPRSISISLGNSNLVVQRVDILKPVAKIEALGDGEHLIETFLHEGKAYEIYSKVTDGKAANQLTIKAKK